MSGPCWGWLHNLEEYGLSKKLLDASEQLKADAVFLVLGIANPRQYDIVEGNEVEARFSGLARVFEKPKKPKTNLAIIAICVFRPSIFEALEGTKPDGAANCS